MGRKQQNDAPGTLKRNKWYMTRDQAMGNTYRHQRNGRVEWDPPIDTSKGKRAGQSLKGATISQGQDIEFKAIQIGYYQKKGGY